MNVYLSDKIGKTISLGMTEWKLERKAAINCRQDLVTILCYQSIDDDSFLQPLLPSHDLFFSVANCSFFLMNSISGVYWNGTWTTKTNFYVLNYKCYMRELVPVPTWKKKKKKKKLSVLSVVVFWV